ncbi:uncharacterized protein JN550_003643 [Neoarthrinium moseri]|uniref:uncharacterized protein n=1 Tax=Neoarthrinium moseri TaxID=1658444 RepID=UPI001FDD5DD5|nr:uncharacterized protein JN550_003643 [Neoarthrinium moseri]KAI1872769.1 hypothetical protein JN550_003643 [Neoarthrinium moseri]
MACCYIAAFCINHLIKACQFLDIGDNIKYNEDKATLGPDAPDPGLEIKLQAGAASGSSLTLSLGGLTCSSCTSAVEEALLALPSVAKVRVSLTLQQATVIGNSNKDLNEDLILQSIRSIGYDAQPGPRSPREIVELLQYRDKTDHLGSTLSHIGRCATLLQALTFCLYLLPGRSTLVQCLRWCLHTASIIVILYVQFIPVYWIHQDGWKWLRGGRMNMNTLTSLSMGLGSLLPCMDWLARKYVDILSRRAASKDLAQIYKPILETDFALLHPTMERVPTSYLRPADKILVEPHSVIPCDSYVLEGSSLIGQSIVTGESLPVKKHVGDYLLGGTRNLTSPLVCVVQREKGSSFYTKLVQSAAESSSESTENHRLLNTITRHFVAVVIGLSFTIPLIKLYPLIGNVSMYDIFYQWVSQTVTILTSACPCAVNLAIPSAVVAAVVTACRQGIIVTGGINTIEKLEMSQKVVFDKTGTLTQAKLHVENFHYLPEWVNQGSILWEYACTVESQVINQHPIARAIFSSGLRKLGPAWTENQHLRRYRNLVCDSGQGIMGEVQLGKHPWRNIVMGNSRYLMDTGVTDVPEKLAMDNTGMIVVHMGIDMAYAGTFLVSDSIRDEAHYVVQSLVAAGYECGMLTGDTQESASRVSQKLGIPIIKAQALPDEKRECIQALQRSGDIVTMVGDGLNDAPSLSAAGVGIGLQKDTTISTIGGAVIIVNSSLQSVLELYNIAKMTMSQVRFNLSWILAYNIVSLSLSTGLFAPFNMSLSPSAAALMMSFSSVFMTLGCFRLRKRLEGVVNSRNKGTPVD